LIRPFLVLLQPDAIGLQPIVEYPILLNKCKIEWYIAILATFASSPVTKKRIFLTNKICSNE
ncbi:hypothetical protein, partial [Legionella anisa]|uniref:hypothetical protein n=1 Tax=Legionella anisa TaxID=28082 RepID=UPI00399CB9C4